MTIEVTVDPELCIGSGDCARVAPRAFRLDDVAGVSSSAPDGVIATDPAVVVQAARGCPTQAIRIVSDGAVVHGSN